MELKRTVAFSVLSVGMVFAINSCAFIIWNLTYPENLLESPTALMSFLLTALLVPISLRILWSLTKDHQLLLEQLAGSVFLALGTAGAVLGPYPIYMRMQDPTWDPDGIGCCIALGYLSLVFIPLGIIWRWRVLKQLGEVPAGK